MKCLDLISVHSAPPFLSLTSSGVAALKVPGALGVYRLSRTNMDSPLLLGYTSLDVNEEFHLFFNFRRREESVSRRPFSREANDLVLSRNKSRWFLMCGGAEFVEDPTVRLLPMDTAEDHGEFITGVSRDLSLSSDCELGQWVAGPCSRSCGGGLKVVTRQVVRHSRGHGRACSGETETEVECNTQPCGQSPTPLARASSSQGTTPSWLSAASSSALLWRLAWASVSCKA